MRRKTYKRIAVLGLGILLGMNIVWLVNALPLDGRPEDRQALTSLLLLSVIIFGVVKWDRSESQGARIDA